MNKLNQSIYHQDYLKLKSQKKVIKKQLEIINDKIYQYKRRLIEDCRNSDTGHIWKTEREDGPYGEKFTWCSRCNCCYLRTPRGYPLGRSWPH